MNRSCSALGALLVMMVALHSTRASADLPPPDGQKFVGYSFAVKGLAAAPDRTLFAYPCGGSNGAPIIEHAKIEDGKSVSVGRRGGDCAIYSIDKAAYDELAKTYEGNPRTHRRDPALDALVAKSVKCEGSPSPSFVLPKSDSRSELHETFAVTTLNATTCILKPESAGSANAGSSPPPNKPPGAKSGCAQAAGRGSPGAGLFALGLALVVSARELRRLRRRRG